MNAVQEVQEANKESQRQTTFSVLSAIEVNKVPKVFQVKPVQKENQVETVKMVLTDNEVTEDHVENVAFEVLEVTLPPMENLVNQVLQVHAVLAD